MRDCRFCNGSGFCILEIDPFTPLTTDDGHCPYERDTRFRCDCYEGKNDD